MNSDEIRFWSKVVKPNDSCWFWTGGLFKSGYGAFWFYDKNVTANWYLYVIHFSKPEKGLLVTHSCNIRSCVRPDHLSLGTAYDNAVDRVLAGNSGKGEKHGRSILKEVDVHEIRQLLNDGVRQSEISILYGVSVETVSAIKNKKRWGWLK